MQRDRNKNVIRLNLAKNATLTWVALVPGNASYWIPGGYPVIHGLLTLKILANSILSIYYQYFDDFKPKF